MTVRQYSRGFTLTNRLFRARLINSIRHAINEAGIVGSVQHPGLIGRYRELLAANILRPMLPMDYALGTGKIVDSIGSMTSEVDLVIFNRNAIPPILWSERDGIFPVESCLYAIEVKSRLSATEIQDSIAKARQALLLKQRNFYTPGYELSKTELCFALFAFDSDKESVEQEILRYCQYDSAGRTDPAVNVICVAGKSYGSFDPVTKQWRGRSGTDEFDETIEFVAGLVNTVLLTSSIQTHGLILGPYLMDDQGSGVCEEGKKWMEMAIAKYQAHESKPSVVLQPALKTGRNNPCPCGSGKKFKKCHGVR
jgi:hypothetical protein